MLRIEGIRALYSDLSAVYQSQKPGSPIPLPWIDTTSSELDRTSILMAALALTTNRSMNPGALAQEKTAPAERIETMETYRRSPADNLVLPKPLDQDGPVTEVLTLILYIEWHDIVGHNDALAPHFRKGQLTASSIQICAVMTAGVI